MIIRARQILLVFLVACAVALVLATAASYRWGVLFSRSRPTGGGAGALIYRGEVVLSHGPVLSEGGAVCDSTGFHCQSYRARNVLQYDSLPDGWDLSSRYYLGGPFGPPNKSRLV